MQADDPKSSDFDGTSGSPDLNQVWAEFNERISTEKEAVEEIYRFFEESGNGISCPCCGCPHMIRRYGARTTRCPDCKHRGSITAGTFFHGAKKLRAHLGAIWLFEHGVRFNASDLRRFIGTAYSSALGIYKKVAMVIEGEMHENVSSTSSAVFLPVIGRRSRLTPAEMHPAAEEEAARAQAARRGTGSGSPSGPGAAERGLASEGDRADRDPAGVTTQPHSTSPPGSRVTTGEAPPAASQSNESPAPAPPSEDAGVLPDSPELSREAAAVLDLIGDREVQFEELHQATAVPVGELSAIVCILEIEGWLERLAGDRYRRAGTDPAYAAGWGHTGGGGGNSLETGKLAKEQKRCQKIIRSLLSTFGGVSRKYLQNYLAVHWNQLNWHRRSAGDLLKRCLRSPPVAYVDILAYISPPSVKHADPAQA